MLFQRYLQVLIKLSLFILAFTPLVVVWSTLFPFIFGKTIFIRTAVALFWVLFAVYLIYQHQSAKISINQRLNNQHKPAIHINQLKSVLISVVRNPLFIFISLFVLLMLFSTIFSVNPFRAFFGDIERGEGYLGILYFFGFFIASLLVFEKKDWLIFFKLSLLTGSILFFHGLYQYADYERMQSFIGNPAFLAGYFLFIIFAALVILIEDKNRWWRLFGGLSVLMATVGVFLTQTRGAIVGLIAGVAFAILYFAIKGKGRRAGIALVLLGVLFLGIFVVTRNNPVWQKIPGVNRFASLSYNDPSFQTRLIAAGVSLDAVNPSKNSLERFLIGWGPENFSIAYNKHYNPDYLKYENLWFDRAHNKLFDVLVMDGILGFLAYLGIWLSILYLVFRRSASIRQNQHESVSEKSALISPNPEASRQGGSYGAGQHESASLNNQHGSAKISIYQRLNNPYLSASIIFFAVAYFVQNLFLFDQISTYIPFFAFLAFVISETTRVNTNSSPSASISQNQHKSAYTCIVSLVALFFAYCLIIYSFTAFYQNIKFTSAIKSGSAQRVFDDVDKFTKPYNYAQRELRNRFLQLTASYANNQGLKPLVDKSISLFEEVVLREPFDPRYFTLLADAYQVQAELGNVEARKKSDEYFLKALELSPKRQELLYNIALNVYGDKGDFKIMEEYLDKMLNYAPDVPMAKIYYATAITMEGPQKFNKGMDLIESALSNLTLGLDEQQLNALRNVYNLYLNYFYDKRDSDRFLTAMEGAKKIELMIEKINEGKYRAGLIKTLPAKKSEEFSRGIEGFKKMGWLAIEKK